MAKSHKARPINARGINAPSTDSVDTIYALTIRQSAFVHEYLKCDHAALAAVKAGYKPSTARNIGENLLSNPAIGDAILARRQALAIDTGLTAQDVINELKKVAFANLSDYGRINEDGDPIVDLSQTTRGQMAALAEATTETYMEGKGKDAVRVKKAKIKLHDKIAALEKLGKTFGLFSDRTEHTGVNGGPIAIAQRWQVELVPCPTPNQAPPSAIQ